MGEAGKDAGQSYDEVDVTDWELSGDEQMGTKPKRWLIEPGTDWRWLLKEATFNLPSQGPAYRKGDDWAERIASAVAEVINVSAATVELAVVRSGDVEIYGTVSRSIVGPRDRLVLGNALLEDRNVIVTSRHRSRYTVDAVRAALDGVPPPEGFEGQTSLEVFVGFFGPGRTDRQHRPT